MSKAIILVLALFLGGWLLFDGSRALASGSYTTPRTGAHAGQLGPWSFLVSAVGLDPHGTLIKLIHVGLGLAWLFSAGFYFLRAPADWWPLLVCALCSLWYLPTGTLIGLLVIGLLYFSGARSPA